jgi:hypothetical protein
MSSLKYYGNSWAITQTIMLFAVNSVTGMCTIQNLQNLILVNVLSGIFKKFSHIISLITL